MEYTATCKCDTFTVWSEEQDLLKRNINCLYKKKEKEKKASTISTLGWLNGYRFSQTINIT